MGADVVLTPSGTPPLVASAPPPGLPPLIRLVIWPLLVISVAVALGYGLRTSALQAWLLPQYTARIQYSVADGPSKSIAFTRSGASDDLLGPPRLAEFQSRLEARGFEVERQAVA